MSDLKEYFDDWIWVTLIGDAAIDLKWCEKNFGIPGGKWLFTKWSGWGGKTIIKFKDRNDALLFLMKYDGEIK